MIIQAQVQNDLKAVGGKRFTKAVPVCVYPICYFKRSNAGTVLLLVLLHIGQFGVISPKNPLDRQTTDQLYKVVVKIDYFSVRQR